MGSEEISRRPTGGSGILDRVAAASGAKRSLPLPPDAEPILNEGNDTLDLERRGRIEIPKVPTNDDWGLKLVVKE